MQLKAHYSLMGNQNLRKMSYKNANLKTCNSSHNGALMQLMPINFPHGHQKPIKRGHFQHSKDEKNKAQILKKKLYNVATMLQ